MNWLGRVLLVLLLMTFSIAAESYLYYDLTCGTCMKVMNSPEYQKYKHICGIKEIAFTPEISEEIYKLLKQHGKEYYDPVFIVKDGNKIFIETGIKVLDEIKCRVKYNYCGAESCIEKHCEKCLLKKEDIINNLLITLGIAFSDSINPCIISILILLLTQLIEAGGKRKVFLIGMSYSFAVFLSYFILGLILFLITTSVYNYIKPFEFYIILILSLGMFIFGIINIKDFFFYGKWISFGIPDNYKKIIKKYASQFTLIGVLILAILVTIIEFPCSGAMYVGWCSLFMLSKFTLLEFLPYLVIYNLIFILPLILSTLFVAYGGEVIKLDEFRMKYRKWMRLIMGIVFIILALYFISKII